MSFSTFPGFKGRSAVLPIPKEYSCGSTPTMGTAVEVCKMLPPNSISPSTLQWLGLFPIRHFQRRELPPTVAGLEIIGSMRQQLTRYDTNFEEKKK
jgi:hypothetical protein